MDSKPISGAKLVVLAAIVSGLAFAPQAEAKFADEAKFKVLSLSGTTTSARDVVYDPSEFGTCAFSETERIDFHSTKRVKAYVFSGVLHGSLRTAWSPDADPDAGLISTVEVLGEATVSRSASYEQTGEGCYFESKPTNCAVERTLPVTLVVGGTSASDEGAYIEAQISSREDGELDDACSVQLSQGTDGPGLFSRVDLFDQKQKRLRDSDRVEEPVFDNPTDNATVSGSIIQEIAAKLKRRKLRR